MEYFNKFSRRFQNRLIGLLCLSGLSLIGGWGAGKYLLGFSGWQLLVVMAASALLAAICLGWLGSLLLIRPFRSIAQAMAHVSPTSEPVPMPDPAKAGFGHELVATIIHQLYELTAIAAKLQQNDRAGSDLHQNFILNNLPLPLFVLNKTRQVVFANFMAGQYLGRPVGELEHQSIDSLLDLSFQSEPTLENWLAGASKQSVTATRIWEQVRLNLSGQPLRQIDLAVYYNQNNAAGQEISLVLFDHSERYGRDDRAIALTAMAVHELRTPLTLLRGYVETLEDDLGSAISTTEAATLKKMEAAGQQLAAFVNNVLNVARIEDDQFLVKLEKLDWPALIASVINDMQLRAQVRGISLVNQTPADLPPAGADQTSMYEVVVNLLDNAIKYSTPGKNVYVSARLTDDGFIETTVKDQGVGIPESVIPNLFIRFYRNHRTRSQVAGTGLGLYLCKTVVNAHGGNIWIRSKEGEGTIIGFTLLPYDQLKNDLQGGSAELTRVAHGWIKNHSLYRR